MATTTIRPDGDITYDWYFPTAAQHYIQVDDAITYPTTPSGDANRIMADGFLGADNNQYDRFTFENPLGIGTVSRIDIYAFGQIDNDGSAGNYPELSVDELHRCFSEDKDVKMIKIHPIFTSSSMKDKRMKKIYEFASDRKLVILVHTWLDGDQYGKQDIFADVAKDYPDIKWIMGHSGGPHGSYHAVEIANEIDNIFLDITLSTVPARQIEFFVSEVGSERVIFGTDNPFLDPRPQIGRIGLADISHQDRINIFSANAHRLIDF